MTTRCKVRCDQVTLFSDYKTVAFTPVTSGSKENESFFKYTPGGKIELQVVNKEVEFHPGKEYFIDITRAD